MNFWFLPVSSVLPPGFCRCPPSVRLFIVFQNVQVNGAIVANQRMRHLGDTGRGVWILKLDMYVYTPYHGNPKPSFLGVITHILGV